jgi:dihydroceramidase
MAGPIKKYDFLNMGVDRVGKWTLYSAASTMQWCEEKYVVTPWICEFWNTISNVGFIGPSLHGLKSCFTHGFETRFKLAFLLASSVGFGSSLFHSTLLYTTQLSDELPMIYHSLTMAYCGLEMTRRRGNPFLAFGLVVFAVWFTYYYIQVDKNPVFHEAVFFIAMHISLFTGLYNTQGTDVKLKQARNLLLFGAVQSYFAFFIWNMDNIYCKELREIRIRYPTLYIITQGHAIWHILIGAGLYTVQIHQLYLRQHYLERNVRLHWWLNWIPYIQE